MKVVLNKYLYKFCLTVYGKEYTEKHYILDKKVKTK